MINALESILQELRKIEVNLKKLPLIRRTAETLATKLQEADTFYAKFNSLVKTAHQAVHEGSLSAPEVENVREISNIIRAVYLSITNFCSESENSCVIQDESEATETMEQFNLKTAVSLLPQLNGDEEVTKQLIDSIDLYSSMIATKDHAILIKFVLKTRLTQNAKLRLSPAYSSVDVLLTDMRNHLLTKQSSTALHNELLRASQSSATLEDYGKRIEDLFVRLTVSQSDGNDEAYKILKPLNEKLAIKRFTDGLRNRNLSIILAARDYSSLKDVIRAAKDEELSSTRPDTEGNVYFHQRGGRGTRRNNRGRSYNQSQRGYNQSRGHQAQPRGGQPPRARGRGNGRPGRGYYYRGRGTYNYNNQAYLIGENSGENSVSNTVSAENSTDTSNSINFFRG